MSVRFIHKRRNLPRARPARAQHYAAERWEPKVYEGWLRSIRATRRAFDMPSVRAALERNHPEIAAQVMPWAVLERNLEQNVLPHIRNAMRDGANAAAKHLGVKKVDLPDVIQVLNLLFDLDNPRVKMWLAQYGAQWVTFVRNETRLAIREIVVAAQQRGLNVTQQADLISSELRRDFGLNRQQARSLSNYEAGLLDQGMPRSRVNGLVRDYRDRLIDSRARTIARHETMKGSNIGQHEVWQQAIEQGFLPPDQQRRWVTQPELNSDNPCPVCEPMDGQVRSMGEEFSSPHNGDRAVIPPMHVNCECVLVLHFADE